MNAERTLTLIYLNRGKKDSEQHFNLGASNDLYYTSDGGSFDGDV